MLFWTIVFFTVSLISLTKGNIFRSTATKLKEVELKKLDGLMEDTYFTEIAKAGCFPLLLVSTLAIAEVIYLIKALNIDPYKYPTIAAVAVLVIGLIRYKRTKNVANMDENELIVYKASLLQKEKRSFISVIRSLLWTSYFGYMFYTLVFVIN